MRAKLIEIIESYASDEFTINDWIDMASRSEEELLCIVENILEFYVNEYHAS